jgi:ADP-heptose:LPS heptosyltransferase
MYRGGQHVVTHTEHRFILTHGALGDIITSLPALVNARKRTPLKLTAYVPDWQREFIAYLLAPYGEFDVRDIAEVPLAVKDRMEEWGSNVPNSLNSALQNTHTRNRVHMVDYAFAFLSDSRPESMLERSYPTAALLGPRTIDGPYVVFPVGATSDNKLFRASVMVPILQWCVENGYRPVLVGNRQPRTNALTHDGKLEVLVIRDQAEMIPQSLLFECLDLREKTTLLELRDVCGHANAVVGVDGGTLHIAGTTDVPIIYAMGTTLPKHRYIARIGDHTYKIRYVLPRDLECTGCQSNWQMTRWDFRFCAYGDNACMEKLDPNDFINGLKELGL